MESEDVADNLERCVWEPAMVFTNALTAASEAAALVLSVDETIKAPRHQNTVGDQPVRRRPM